MKKSDATKTEVTKTAKTVTRDRSELHRFGTVVPDTWEKYVGYCEARGTKTSAFYERVIGDVVKGRYIHVQQLMPEAVAELERTSKEQMTALDTLVTNILAEWCKNSMAARRDKKG